MLFVHNWGLRIALWPIILFAAVSWRSEFAAAQSSAAAALLVGNAALLVGNRGSDTANSDLIVQAHIDSSTSLQFIYMYNMLHCPCSAAFGVPSMPSVSCTEMLHACVQCE